VRTTLAPLNLEIFSANNIKFSKGTQLLVRLFLLPQLCDGVIFKFLFNGENFRYLAGPCLVICAERLQTYAVNILCQLTVINTAKGQIF
jgi:hypothetical protein